MRHTMLAIALLGLLAACNSKSNSPLEDQGPTVQELLAKYDGDYVLMVTFDKTPNCLSGVLSGPVTVNTGKIIGYIKHSKEGSFIVAGRLRIDGTIADTTALGIADMIYMSGNIDEGVVYGEIGQCQGKFVTMQKIGVIG